MVLSCAYRGAIIRFGPLTIGLRIPLSICIRVYIIKLVLVLIQIIERILIEVIASIAHLIWEPFCVTDESCNCNCTGNIVKPGILSRLRLRVALYLGVLEAGLIYRWIAVEAPKLIVTPSDFPGRRSRCIRRGRGWFTYLSNDSVAKLAMILGFFKECAIMGEGVNPYNLERFTYALCGKSFLIVNYNLSIIHPYIYLDSLPLPSYRWPGRRACLYRYDYWSPEWRHVHAKIDPLAWSLFRRLRAS